MSSENGRDREVRVDPQVRDAIAGEIAARLRRVCEHWPEGEFQDMVQRLADITIKYDRVAPTAVYDRRAGDRIVVDLKAALERSENVRRNSGEVSSRHDDVELVRRAKTTPDDVRPNP